MPKQTSPMGFFERYLSLWVFLCILAGTLLGLLAPAAAQAIGALEIAQVNIPVGLLIWVMIIPMLMKIDFRALHQIYQQRTDCRLARRLDGCGLARAVCAALIHWTLPLCLVAQCCPPAGTRAAN